MESCFRWKEPLVCKPVLGHLEGIGWLRTVIKHDAGPNWKFGKSVTRFHSVLKHTSLLSTNFSFFFTTRKYVYSDTSKVKENKFRQISCFYFVFPYEKHISTESSSVTLLTLSLRQREHSSIGIHMC